MDNREAVKWLINISADIGKAEHSDLWHYEQALTEIKDMLEYAQLSREGATKDTTSDAISRQAAIDVFNTDAELFRRALDNADIVGVERAKYEWCIDLIELYIDDMKKLPPAQPEQKVGRWILHPEWEIDGECSATCSECEMGVDVLYNFCPRCGAKMERRTDD